MTGSISPKCDPNGTTSWDIGSFNRLAPVREVTAVEKEFAAVIDLHFSYHLRPSGIRVIIR
jgi:hypothetical protein